MPNASTTQNWTSGRTIGGIVVVLVVIGGGLWWFLRKGPTVTMLGDSITVVSGNAIRDAFGRDYDPHFSAILGIAAEQMLQQAKAAAADNPQQVVIELGSNDVLHRSPVTTANAALAQIVADFPKAKCIHIVNVNTHMTNAGAPVPNVAGQINTAIAAMKAADPRIDIIDWNATISQNIAANPPRGNLTSDTVHPNAAGQKVLAKMMRDALDACHT